MRRRFQKRIYIPLPDKNARVEIIGINLKNVEHTLKQSDIVEISESTDGYSGSDISNLVRCALMEPIRTCTISTHFKKVTFEDKQFYTPCSENEEGAIEMTLDDMKSAELLGPK
jgi:vacuolar protein-sorting-associated protein 4